jgi:hypothetical protein
MYEYEIMRKADRERDYIYGYTYQDALKRAGYKESEYILLYRDYLD